MRAVSLPGFQLCNRPTRYLRPVLVTTTDVRRSARSRRRLTVVIVSAVVVVVVALVWWLTSPSKQPAGVSGRDGGSMPQGPATDTPVAGYAVAIRALAEQVHGPGVPPVIYLLDRTCPDVMSAPPVDTDCDTPVPADLRRDLTAALASFSRVEFVSTAAAVTGADLEIANDGVLTMLGQAQFAAGSGEVP